MEIYKVVFAASLMEHSRQYKDDELGCQHLDEL